ncbi:hypothetical protein QBC47DRAFT_417608 [Echria macrotheca]|uniref:Uncharacterized protein n=1 Tax=Echria macrotheca TaxID=438768 RepID=A0AAJ0B4R1_9PEZI|nr:hypothetical protein QBC47DRAFT_417608 [Echria macrotheca]
MASKRFPLLIALIRPVFATQPAWLNSSTTVYIPPWQSNASCEINGSSFFDTIASACKDEIEAVQTCPGQGSDVTNSLDAAVAFSDCFEKQFYSSFYCSGWTPRKDGSISLWKPFGHPPTYINSSDWSERATPKVNKGDCQYPEFLPILQNGCSPMITAVEKQSTACCTSQAPINNNFARDLVACVVQGSVQYVRCANTLGSNDVEGCVAQSAPKATYLPPGIFIYEGSKECKPATFMMIYIAFSYIIELLELLALRWKNQVLWLVPKPQEGFSLYKLLLHLVKHTAEPFIMAAIVSGQAYDGAMITELVLFLMTPRVAPVIALICAFYPGWRGFGAQQLAIDVVFAFITISGWGLVPGSPIETFHADAGAPSDLVGAYNLGISLSIMPNWIVISLAANVAVLWVLAAPKGKHAERIGHIVGIALFCAGLLASLPFFALYEFVYGWVDRSPKRREREAYSSGGSELDDGGAKPGLDGAGNVRRRRLGRFAQKVPSYFRTTNPDLPPPKPHLGWLKSFFRSWFPAAADEGGRPWKRIIGYGALLGSSFCITVGNWMATVTLLNMAGEVFCPSKIWALVFAKFGITLVRFLLDIIHVP